MKNKKAFTLVELIIVIAIIAILSVLAYLEITKRIKISRDTSRTADLTTIEKALNIALVEKSKVPLPDENTTITASGDIIGYQGVFGETVKDFIGNISKAPQDSADKAYYTYYVDKTQKYFQLLGFAENKTSYNPNYANAVDYSQRYILTRGNNLGIIVDSNQTPVNQLLTGFDVMTGIVNDTGYTAIFDSNDKLSGTGQTLQWLWSNVNNGGAGYNSPSNCPEGFIPVPGNKDFNQPGFCVAKYEMKQKEGTAGVRMTGNNVGYWDTGMNEICGPGVNRCLSSIDASDKLDGKIESKPEGMPIVFLNQATAIRSCSKMGNGYHLITNKEYMTIARNIESQGENWTGGKVGVGGIYIGKDIRNDSSFTDADNHNPDTLSCQGGQNVYGLSNDKSQTSLGTSTACQITKNGMIRNKRALKLSNNQRIRDLAGNVWENVNKADTINGLGYLSGIVGYVDSLVIFDTTESDWDGLFSWHSTGWISANISVQDRNKYGPSNAEYGTGQGMGNIFGKKDNDISNVFVRGGYGYGSVNNGIYAFYLYRGAGNSGGNVGFRCAR